MKRVCLLLWAVLPLTGAAQIAVRKTEVVERAVMRPQRFDSLENVIAPARGREVDLKKYLEQELFFIPMTEAAVAEENRRRTEVEAAEQELASLRARHKAIEAELRAGSATGRRSSLRQAAVEERQRAYYRLIPKISAAETRLASLNRQPYSPYGRYTGGFLRCDSTGLAAGWLDYGEVQERYYAILDLVQAQGAIGADGKGRFVRAEEYGSRLAFLLRERETGACLLWYFDRPEQLNLERNGFNARDGIPFAMLTSYFLKAQRAFEGRELVAVAAKKGFVDIRSGEVVDLVPGEVWRCMELSLMPFGEVALPVAFCTLERDGGAAIRVRLPARIRNVTRLSDDFITRERYLDELRQRELLEEQLKAEREAREEANRRAEEEFRRTCVARYGQRMGGLIAEGRVVLGMSCEMCEMAWGAPCRINRTIVSGATHEQWVYGWHHYLYFDNGVLTAIQD